MDGFLTSQPLEPSLFERAEELGLCSQREVADLIEEQSAVIGLLESSGLADVRASERAFLVAEELGFEQRVWQGRAVDSLKLFTAPAAELVDHACHDFFAAACWSENEHGDVRLGGRADPLEDHQHLLVAADHVSEALDRWRLIL